MKKISIGCGRLFNQRGFGILEILITVGLMGIILAGTSSMFVAFYKQQGQINFTTQAAVIRNNLIAALNNSTAWQNTIKSNANNFSSGVMLDCQFNSKPCTTDQAKDLSAGGTPIGFSGGFSGGSMTPKGVLILKIFDSAGSVVLDSSLPTQGFSNQGTVCNTFNATPGAGDDACPLRFEVHWWAMCNSISKSCVGAQPLLQIFAIYNPKSDRYAFNSSNYGTPAFLQGQTPGGACWQIMGTNLVETCAPRVGIGTENPTSGLTLEGDGGVKDDFTLASYSPATGSWAGLVYFQRSRANSSASKSPVLADDSLGYIRFDGDDGTGFQYGGGLGMFAENSWSAAASTINSGMVFYTTEGRNATEKMRVTSKGNVGIGTTTPTNKLTVAGGDAMINGVTVGLGGRLGGAASASNNAALGLSALKNNTGQMNTAVGAEALMNNTTGGLNSAFGWHALYNATTGDTNTAIGDNSMYFVTRGRFNTAVGVTSLSTETTGQYSVAIGGAALASQNSTSGARMNNTAVGTNAGFKVTTGTDNIFIGANSGFTITTGNRNIVIGESDFTGTNPGVTTGSNNVIIGNMNNLPAAMSNSVVIGDGNGSERIRVDGSGRMGVGTTAPNYRLDVAGDINTSTCLRAGGAAIGGSCSSDARLKDNIQDYKQGLKELLGVRVRTYEFNGSGEMPKTGQTDVGVIAQEIEKTNPDLVTARLVQMRPEDSEKTEIKVVNYSTFTYMLINAVKDLNSKIQALLVNQRRDHDASVAADAAKDVRIKRLEKENAALKAYICAKDVSAPICD